MMYKYKLDSSTKFDCPICGHRNRFVRYKDTTTNIFLMGEYGKCDRVESCGHWQKPEGTTIEGEPTEEPEEKDLFTSYTLDANKYIIRYHNNQFKQENNFLRGIAQRFGIDKAVQVHKQYNLGTWFDGAVVFPYYFEGSLHSGQIMWYDNDLHRSKEPKHHTTWLHKFHYIDSKGKEHNSEYNLFENLEIEGEYYGDKYYQVTPLFGWDLIRANPDKQLCLVEAPKTACIMSIVLPEYTWLACTMLSGIQEYKFPYNHNKQWLLFPDLCKDGKHNIEYWQKSMNKIKYKYNTCFDVVNYYPPKIDTESKVMVNEMGFDMADFVLMEQEKKMPLTWLNENETYVEHIRTMINQI